jgi:hypothetical protein
MIFFLFLFVFHVVTSSAIPNGFNFSGIAKINLTFNDITQIILYNPEQYSNRIINVFVNDTIKTFYSIAVQDNSVIFVSELICTPVQTSFIVTGPQACPGQTAANSLEPWRCTSTLEQAIQLDNLINTLFPLDPSSSECLSNGGDVNSCFGPLIVVMEGYDQPVEITNETLIASFGVGAASGYGYGCASPSFTWIPVQLPKIQISTTDCLDSFNGTFAGTYKRQQRDQISNLDIVKVFSEEIFNLYHRLVFRRDYWSGNLYVSLETNDGVTDYTAHWSSLDIIPNDWQNYFPYLNLNLSSNLTQNLYCTLNLTLVPIYLPLQAEPPVVPTINNYYDILPRSDYVTAVGNWALCFLDSTGNLMFPNCLEGEVRGGHDLGQLSSQLYQPQEIPADLSYAGYVDECESFYPWAEEFQVFDLANPTKGGAYQAKLATWFCHGPFYNPDAILNAIDPYVEMHRQCSNLGGHLLYGTHCARQTDVRLCGPSLSWVYFKGYCFYRFNYLTDADYYVVNSQASTACSRLGANVVPFIGLTLDDTFWLRNNFIGYLRDVPGHPFRVYIQASECQCYDFQVNPTIDSSTVLPCNCETPAFPLCVYSYVNNPLPHYNIRMSPLTHKLYLNGQVGIPWRGEQRKLFCELGWCNSHCTEPCCPSFEDFTNPLFNQTSNVVRQTFFTNCLTKSGKRGYCLNNDPLTCACMQNYGPQASLHPKSVYYQFKDWPCACYQSVITPFNTVFSPGFAINGNYFSMPLPICGSLTSGQCYVDASTLLSYCLCNQRIKPSSTFIIEYEPAKDGKACDCDLPVQMQSGYVTNEPVEQVTCNSHGVCCSSGEIFTYKTFPDSVTSLYWRLPCLNPLTSEPINGCVCIDNGWTGLLCTCPTNYDLAVGLTVYVKPGGYESYVQLIQPVNIVRIEISQDAFYANLDANGCTVTYVRISQSLYGDYVECNFVPSNTYNTIDYYLCPQNETNILEATFVLVGTVESSGACSIKAYSTNIRPCGNYTNSWASAFFYNERNQGLNFYSEIQSILYGPYGCTFTDCLCDNNSGGPQCALGVSSIRLPSTSTTPVISFCGSDTLPARGTISSLQLGCVCLELQDLQFIGHSCECANGYVEELNEFLPCYGSGICKPVNMPYGICAYDLFDIQNDILTTNPYSGYSYVQENLNYTVNQVRNRTVYDNVLNYDVRSVIRVRDVSWLFSGGSFLQFLPSSTLSIEGNISVAAPQVWFNFEIFYSCEENSGNLPVRMLYNHTIWSLHRICDLEYEFESCYDTLISEEICDIADTQFYPCSVSVYCNEEWVQRGYLLGSDFQYRGADTPLTKCIAGVNFIENLELSGDILTTGNYTNVSFIFADLSRYNSEGNGFYTYPQFDCSNPVDRTLDYAAFLTGNNLQCSNQPITPYSWQLGQAFGLFYNAIPDLSFVNRNNWTDEHSIYMASLLNYKKCMNPKTNLVLDIFHYTNVFGLIIQSWLTLNNLIPPSENFNYTGPLTTYLNLDNVTQHEYYFQGQYGSEVLAQVPYWPYNNHTFNWTFQIRPGYVAELPPIQPNLVISNIVLTVPFTLNGLQIVGGSGQVCTTILRPIAANETFYINCFDTLDVSLMNAYEYILLNAPKNANLTQIAQDFLNEKVTYNLIYYYGNNQYDVYFDGQNVTSPSPGIFNSSNIQITTRDASYLAWFQQIQSMILTQHLFPNSTAYADTCVLYGGTVKNISIPEDNGFLQALHATYFAPRQCTADAQCATETRGNFDNRCLYEYNSYWTPWRNGDPTTTPFEGIGDEGGCECFQGYNLGFFSLQLDCKQCLIGYGPNSIQDWLNVIQFQENQLILWPNLTQVFYSPEEFFPIGTPLNWETLQDKVRCRFPWSLTSSRSARICGGYGSIDLIQLNETWENLIFQDAYEVKRKRRCTTLIFDTYQEYTLNNETVDVNIFSYTYNTTQILNYIYGTLFLNNNPMQYKSTLDDYHIQYEDFYGTLHELECQTNLKTYLDNDYFIQTNLHWITQDFFISYIYNT